MRTTTRVVFAVLSLACAVGTYLSGHGILIANAGPDQSGALVGDTVTLDGSGSAAAMSYHGRSLASPADRTPLLNPSSITRVLCRTAAALTR